MASSEIPNQRGRRQQGPNTLPALREMLIEDPRIGRAEVHSDRHSAAEQDEDPAPKEVDQAPSIAPTSPSIELSLQQPSLPNNVSSNNKPSVARRVFHTVARGFVLIVMLGAAFAFLSYGNYEKKDVVRAWDLSLGWLSSILHTNSLQDRDAAVESISKPLESISKPLDQTLPQSTAVRPEIPGIQAVPAAVVMGMPAEQQHRLDTLASDLVDLRHLVEQLAARQAQMVRDIATLQANELNVSQKISSLSQSPIIRVLHRKAVRTVHQSPLGAYPNRSGSSDRP
jgi:hypothetical protein